MYEDSYTLRFKMQDENGKQWEETHDQISLSDFEVLYGMNMDKLIELDLKLNPTGETPSYQLKEKFYG